MNSFSAALFGAVCLTAPLFAQDTAPHTLTPLTVTGLTPAPLPPQTLTGGPLASSPLELGQALNNLPGLSIAARGPHGGEPVIRGLGWERVKTDFNGLSLHGACPSRMDPPASLLNPATARIVEVDLMAPSVLHGPGGLGGRIRVNTELTWDPADPAPAAGTLLLHAASQGKARGLQTEVQSETPTTAARAEAAISTQGDLFAGDGTRIPARRDVRNLGADTAWRPAEDLTLRFAWRWIEEKDVDFPALPMDTRFSEMDLFTLGSRWTPQNQTLREIDLRIGLQTLDHLMDNRDKPNRPFMEASTPTTSDVLNGRLLSRWHLAGGELRAGLDAARVEREATRTRRMTATGMTFRDPIWPGLIEDQTGLFSEWEGTPNPDLTLRAGLRLDHIISKADNTHLMVMPGPGAGRLSLRQAYIRYGGAGQADPDQDFTLLSGNLRLTRALPEAWTLTAGLARIASAPNQTQLFQGFGARPGGFGVGNPDLEPEIKHQIELRADGSLGPHRLGVAAHAARIDDYLLSTTLARIDITGDGMPNRILGTRNVDATLVGAEASLVLDLPGAFSLPVDLAWVRGENRDDDRPLPEIPPLEGQASLRWEQGTLLEFGVRFAARQDRTDPAFGEDATPGYAVLHLRARREILPGWTLEAGIDNLLDKTYNHHLTREAVLAGGDLAPGDEVPAAGRSLHLALRAEW